MVFRLKRRGEKGSVEVENRVCPLCGSRHGEVLIITEKRAPDGGAYRVVECAKCGLRFTDPLPADDELSTLYGPEYYGNQNGRILSWDFVRQLLHRTVLWQRRFALLGRRPGRILDIGCGDGDFLAYLKRRGWDVYGLEFSPAASELARCKGVTVHQGGLESANFAEKSFDVVSLWHVLEHLPEPQVELAKVRRILRDDGLLVLEVPNSGSPTLRLCGERWFPLDVPRHLQHFTPSTLERSLEQSGFSVVRRQNYHPLDAALAFVSFVDRLGILGHLRGTHYFVTDYRSVSRGRKALFLILGSGIGLYCLVYSLVATVLSGNGETITISARKALT